MRVDMLDTGIDVPEVVNLVFFKLVRSRTKFWQMVGRGTRLSPELFGPGQDKEFFYLFDYCQNLEYFGEHPETTEGGAGESLGKRLFKARLELAAELDERLMQQAASGLGEAAGVFGEPRTDAQLHRAVTDALHREVAAMNLENFVVRPRRHLVEKWSRRDAWANLSPSRMAELAEEVAGLPTALPAESEEARRFDLLILRLQLAALRADPAFTRLREQLVDIAGLLEEKGAIPRVREQMPLIQEVQTDAWWQDVTLPMLEGVRRRLRELVRLIDRRQRRPVYTDFEDEMGPATHVELPGLAAGRDFERFRQKARLFLREHEDHLSIRKLRMDHPLTPSDLAELERMLLDAGIGSQEELRRATEENEGPGLFIRSLVGLDREAAMRALGGFVEGRTLSADQVEFLHLIADHLTQQGYMPVKRLYESPFTDRDPRGVEGVFPSSETDALIQVLEGVRHRAVA